MSTKSLRPESALVRFYWARLHPSSVFAQRPISKKALLGESMPTLLYLGFVLTGIVTVLLGPLLPALATQWALNDFEAGYFFTAQFLGSMLGVGLTSWLLPRYGFRALLLSAYIFMAAGTSALAVVPWKGGLGAVFFYGVGLGLAIPASNLWAAAANPLRRVAALSILNAAWGIGALACAPLLAVARRTAHTPYFLFALAFALVLTSAGFIASASLSGMVPSQNDRMVASSQALSLGTLLVLGFLFFFYVGTENSLGGWIALYTRRQRGVGDTTSTLMPSLFWTMLLLGRTAAPGILNRVSELRLVLMSLLVACLGVIVLVAARGLLGAVVGISLAGLGLAAVYPITLAHLSRLGKTATRPSGPMFALAGLGGATLPVFVGFLSARYGSLKDGLVIPLCGALVMMALYFLAPRWQVGS